MNLVVVICFCFISLPYTSSKDWVLVSARMRGHCEFLFFLCSDSSQIYNVLEISVRLKIQNGCSLIWAMSVNCMSEFVVLFVAMQTIVHSWHSVPVEAVVI